MKMIKRLVRKILERTGYSVKHRSVKSPGTGSMEVVLGEICKRGLKCFSILDVGAHKGEWSAVAAKIFPEARCFLIEPQAEFKKELELFCLAHPDFKYFLCGAGSRCEELVLSQVSPLLMSSTFMIPESEELINRGKQRKIKIVTIDSLIETSEIMPPDLVKIDVEGFELEVLKGAERLFGYTEVFIIENLLFSNDFIPYSMSTLISFMENKGYVVYDFAGFGHREYDGALALVDIVFVKKDGFLRSFKKWFKGQPG